MPFPWAPVLAGVFSAGNTLVSNYAQKRENERAFNRSVKQEQKIFERDAAYNSPSAQMERLKLAGLSPHLMYGQGTVGNTSGNAVQMQPYQVRDAGNVPTQVAQVFGIEKQAQLRDSEIRLKAAQEELVRANPYLSPSYVESLVKNMKALADIKAQERDWLHTNEWRETDKNTVESRPRGMWKMSQDLENLFQEFKLKEMDVKVRAEIIQSKEFENRLKEIQVKWMEDADVTPQHILEAIKIMLNKMH